MSLGIFYAFCTVYIILGANAADNSTVDDNGTKTGENVDGEAVGEESGKEKKEEENESENGEGNEDEKENKGGEEE